MSAGGDCFDPVSLNPEDYDSARGVQALHRLCWEAVQSGTVLADARFESLLLNRATSLGKHEIARVVAAAFVASGPPGVARLIDILPDMPGHIYPMSVIETLWKAATDQPVPAGRLAVYHPSYDLSAEAKKAARIALDDLIIEAQTSGDTFGLMVGLLHQSYVRAASDELRGLDFATIFLDVVRDSSIRLTKRLIDEFRALISQDLAEERYQEFLRDHPVFLDPLAAEVIPKHKLGTEYVTDFVIRRHDFRYVVVEIEKPQDRIFTLGRDFTAEFTHAIGQVLDFQGWVNSNIAYAQTKLPWIEVPHGMLVMGRRSSLNAEAEAKLRRWTANSRSIDILTFDDLIVRAEFLLASLRGDAREPSG